MNCRDERKLTLIIIIPVIIHAHIAVLESISGREVYLNQYYTHSVCVKDNYGMIEFWLGLR